MKPISSSTASTLAPAGVIRLFKASGARIKKGLLLILAVTFLSAQALFAGAEETEATAKLKSALNKEFAGASAVKWYSDDNKTFMASFTLRETKITAYFDADGKLLMTRRFITAQQLPLIVANKLAKRYPKEEVRSVVEFDNGVETVYYVSLEGAHTWKVIKATSNGQLSLYHRMEKA